MHGYVMAYDPVSGDIQVNIVDGVGNGTYSNWSINLDGILDYFQ